MPISFDVIYVEDGIKEQGKIFKDTKAVTKISSFSTGRKKEAASSSKNSFFDSDSDSDGSDSVEPFQPGNSTIDALFIAPEYEKLIKVSKKLKPTEMLTELDKFSYRSLNIKDLGFERLYRTVYGHTSANISTLTYTIFMYRMEVLIYIC